MTIEAQVALTVDLEDSHHGLNISRRASTLVQDVAWILTEFQRLRLRATFFVLGEIVDSHPGLVRQVAADGHEIAFHGADHRFLRDVTPKEFARGLKNGIAQLEDLLGCCIKGFRAPFFSIGPKTQWTLEILAAQGLEYDASIYPGPNDRYGWPGAPTYPVRHGPTGLVLFPVPLLHPRIPVAFSGGAYLRMLPFWMVEWGFRRLRQAQLPGMIYFHPWEVASTVPWRAEAGVRANLTRHAFRGRMRARLERLLALQQRNLHTMATVISRMGNLTTWNPADDHEEFAARLRT